MAKLSYCKSSGRHIEGVPGAGRRMVDILLAHEHDCDWILVSDSEAGIGF